MRNLRVNHDGAKRPRAAGPAPAAGDGPQPRVTRPTEPAHAAATWMVMGTGRRSPRASHGPPASQLLLHLLVALAMLIATVSAECKLKKCSERYSQKLTENGRRNSDRKYCQALVDYRKCVMDIPPRSCRGELNYHSTLSIIPDLMEQNNCEEVLAASEATPTPLPSGATPLIQRLTAAPARPRPRGRCEFYGEPDYKSCSLFGDPHLRTFDGSFQTCRVAGAWPVFYNQYLAAQVTNVQLLHGSGATATTKLSVIIKGHEDCAERKLYLAQTGNLPGAFVDGTRSTGPSGKGAEVLEVVPDKHVEIHVRYIGTVIVVRQIGDYLLFSVRMPEAIIKRQGPQDLQLCVRGCPVREKIDYAEFLKRTEDVDREKLRRAVARCRQTNVIDVYLDSCVFDLLTTSDDNFTSAAESALRDISRLQPNASLSLHNRTSVFEDSEILAALPPRRNSAPKRTHCSMTAYTHVAIVLLALWASLRLGT